VSDIAAMGNLYPNCACPAAPLRWQADATPAAHEPEHAEGGDRPARPASITPVEASPLGSLHERWTVRWPSTPAANRSERALFT